MQQFFLEAASAEPRELFPATPPLGTPPGTLIAIPFQVDFDQGRSGKHWYVGRVDTREPTHGGHEKANH